MVSYVRYRPLQELLKQHLPPRKLVQVVAGSYGRGLLKHGTILYVVGLRSGAPGEIHILEVRVRKNTPPSAGI